MKKGFSLIEVIISILIISFAFFILPLLFFHNNNEALNIKKERSLFYEYDIIKIINLRPFDQNNTVNINTFYEVLQNDGNSALRVPRIGKKELNNNPYRKGTTDYTLSKIGLDKTDNPEDPSTFNDIDDFNDYNFTVNNQVYNVKVFYINDNANYSSNNITFSPSDTKVSDHTTNIKEIEVSTIALDGTKLVSRYFACNIGATAYYALHQIK